MSRTAFVEDRIIRGETLYRSLDDSRKEIVDAFMLFLFQQQESGEVVKPGHSIDTKPDARQKTKLSAESINEWIERNGQPEMFVGEIGIEAMKELTKYDVW